MQVYNVDTLTVADCLHHLRAASIQISRAVPH